jgi:hypothetical protein
MSDGRVIPLAPFFKLLFEIIHKPIIERLQQSVARHASLGNFYGSMRGYSDEESDVARWLPARRGRSERNLLDARARNDPPVGSGPIEIEPTDHRRNHRRGRLHAVMLPCRRKELKAKIGESKTGQTGPRDRYGKSALRLSRNSWVGTAREQTGYRTCLMADVNSAKNLSTTFGVA